jgi:hypothetical protein
MSQPGPGFPSTHVMFFFIYVQKGPHKKSFSSDGQHFNQYQRNKESCMLKWNSPDVEIQNMMFSLLKVVWFIG